MKNRPSLSERSRTFKYLIRNDYNQIFEDSLSIIEVFSREPDSVMPFPSIDPYLDLSFPDAATLPIGKWIIYHLASKRKVAEITYNDYGNYIEVFLYNEGKLLQHFTLPPCDKKKRLIYNVDGSFNREECVDYKVEFGNK